MRRTDGKIVCDMNNCTALADVAMVGKPESRLGQEWVSFRCAKHSGPSWDQHVDKTPVQEWEKLQGLREVHDS